MPIIDLPHRNAQKIFQKVGDSSYRINFPKTYTKNKNCYWKKNKSEHNLSKHNCISECSDPTCIYSRKYTNLRDRFEKKIFMSVINKNKISILFYGSFLLYQELNILKLIGDKISEIHITDYAYKNFLEDNKTQFIDAFLALSKHVLSRKLDINIYVHCDPEKLINNLTFRRRLDIICGIDIDYSFGVTDNRPVMKAIAENTLKIDGIMYLSQHNLDQVDLCRYELAEFGRINLVQTDDFVKPDYYIKYKLNDILQRTLYYLNIFVPLSLSLAFYGNPIICITSTTYTIVSLIDKYLFGNSNIAKINIKKIGDLFINEKPGLKHME